MKKGGPKKRPQPDRLISRIDKNESFCGCWFWIGAKHDGYGTFRSDEKKTLMAHRAVYELLVGDIPAGLTLDHLCRNRWCVNPTHLEPVTLVENLRRGVGITAKNKAKTHCKNGHLFDPENTMYYSKKYPLGRACRKCQAERNRKFRTRQIIA